jgi:hypothetical protein
MKWILPEITNDISKFTFKILGKIILPARQEPTGIVRCFGGHVFEFTIDGIVNRVDRQRSALAFGHVRQSTQNALDAFQVMSVRTVRHVVVVHNLNAAELRVRMNFPSQQSVKSTTTS